MDTAIFRKPLVPLVLLGVALAGCTVPEEAVPGDNDTEPGDGVSPTPLPTPSPTSDGTGPSDNESEPTDGANMSRVVVIDLRPYECDPILAQEGEVCDHYRHNATASRIGAQRFETEEDGSVMIDGYEYRCAHGMEEGMEDERNQTGTGGAGTGQNQSGAGQNQSGMDGGRGMDDGRCMSYILADGSNEE